MSTAFEITGAVASLFTVTLIEFVPPLEVAVHVKVTPVVSVVTVVGSQPVFDDTADSASVTVQDTETFDVYQPLFPSVPVTVGVITGGVASVGVFGSDNTHPRG